MDDSIRRRTYKVIGLVGFAPPIGCCLPLLLVAILGIILVAR